MSGRRYRNNRSIIPPNKSSPEAAAITQVKAEFHSFSGPLPPPEALARYNEVIPGGAERILAMAERQSAHRELLEAEVVSANVSSQKMGSLFYFVFGRNCRGHLVNTRGQERDGIGHYHRGFGNSGRRLRVFQKEAGQGADREGKCHSEA